MADMSSCDGRVSAEDRGLYDVVRRVVDDEMLSGAFKVTALDDPPGLPIINVHFFVERRPPLAQILRARRALSAALREYGTGRILHLYHHSKERADEIEALMRAHV